MIVYVLCGQCKEEVKVKVNKVVQFKGNNLGFCSEKCSLIWSMWMKIHPSLNLDLKEKWEEKGFSYLQCQEWIKLGLETNEHSLAAYLRGENYNTERKGSNLDEWKSEWAKSSKQNRKWLDQNYPKEIRKEIENVYLFDPSLEGELNLGDFTSTQLKIYISCRVDDSKLEIKDITRFYDHDKDLKREVEIIKLSQVQGEIDKSERKIKKATYLHIENKNREGKLDLLDFINLEKLVCFNSFISNLALTNNSDNLRTLDLGDNNFFAQNLSFLVQANNLEWLNLGNLNKEKINQGIYNHFTGSLDYLSGMKKLKYLDISNTDIDAVDINKLSTSLEEIYYSTKERPESKLAQIIPQLKKYEHQWKDIHSDFSLAVWKNWKEMEFSKEQVNEWIQVGVDPYDYNFVSWLKNIKKLTPQEFLLNKSKEVYWKLRERCNEFDWCRRCQQINTSQNWCQLCAERKWQENLKQLTGQDLVSKFIEEQSIKSKQNNLKLIPYNQLNGIRHLADGGFSRIYKAKLAKRFLQGKIVKGKKENKNVILKILNNSQNITLDFLREITNHKLVDESPLIVSCYGISQDPKTKNYVMVMQYIEGDNLRNYLKKSFEKLPWENKLNRLHLIVQGLYSIHQQGLVHRDFHSGNVLSNYNKSFITDLGLCRPANEEDDNKIYGVLPYIAPEVLRGQHYKQECDIYSFGVVAYEVLTGLSPYYEYAHDEFLAIKICQGLRPNLDKIGIPQLLEDLVSKCWDANPLNRPNSSDLEQTLSEIKNINISQQYQNNSIYSLHPQAIYTNRHLDFKNLPQPQNSQEINQIFYKLTEELEDLRISDTVKFSQELKKRFNNLQIQEKSQGILLESEEVTPIKTLEQPVISANWTNIHPNLTEKLIYQWQSLVFTYQQTHDWISIGLQPTDHHFAAFLRDQKHLTPEEVLNHGNLETLNQEFSTWQAQQFQIETPPKGN